MIPRITVKVDVQAYQHVFEQMGYTDEEGAYLLLRTQLLKEVKEEILKRKWTQVQAAKELGVKQPRISEIFALRIDKFSVEILIRYLHRLNKEVVFKIKKKGS